MPSPGPTASCSCQPSSSYTQIPPTPTTAWSRHLSLGTWLPQPFLSRLLRQPGGVQLPIATLRDVPAPNTAGP